MGQLYSQRAVPAACEQAAESVRVLRSSGICRITMMGCFVRREQAGAVHAGLWRNAQDRQIAVCNKHLTIVPLLDTLAGTGWSCTLRGATRRLRGHETTSGTTHSVEYTPGCRGPAPVAAFWRPCLCRWHGPQSPVGRIRDKQSLIWCLDNCRSGLPWQRCWYTV